MTPEEHYREAEHLAERARDPQPDDGPSRAEVIALAQVHATLATAAGLHRELEDEVDLSGWGTRADAWSPRWAPAVLD